MIDMKIFYYCTLWTTPDQMSHKYINMQWCNLQCTVNIVSFTCRSVPGSISELDNDTRTETETPIIVVVNTVGS